MSVNQSITEPEMERQPAANGGIIEVKRERDDIFWAAVSKEGSTKTSKGNKGTEQASLLASCLLSFLGYLPVLGPGKLGDMASFISVNLK